MNIRIRQKQINDSLIATVESGTVTLQSVNGDMKMEPEEWGILTAFVEEAILDTILFRNLDEAEEHQFRQWTRVNYEVGTEINSLWHPIVRDECARINREAARDANRVPTTGSVQSVLESKERADSY